MDSIDEVTASLVHDLASRSDGIIARFNSLQREVDDASLKIDRIHTDVIAELGQINQLLDRAIQNASLMSHMIEQREGGET